ncbi:threonylcarbamoyl-AMP synthase [Candidatus Daviesbacteria bacterium]|nr:threonylcarbamoyl-AMP synthase [Candidatus Daviesbacteria bacterium]
MNSKIVNLLKNGGVGVMPTDTIYGIVGSALLPQTVEKIYQLRKRSLNKPFIILICSLNDLNHFNIKLSAAQKKFLEKIWPNPLSVVLSCQDENFKYLHRGTNSLAFRLPKDKKLLELLKKVGPLVAPSANIAGEKPAANINEAKKYFSDRVDFYYEVARSPYLDNGHIPSNASTLVELGKDGSYKIIRQGQFKL